MIAARGLGRRFAGVTALAGIDFEVQAGESVAVFGPNGAGKTTLLRLLATLLRPTTGVLELFGEPAGSGAMGARRRTGVLSHRSFLYPDLTPTENLEFYARMYGVRDAPARVRALLDTVGVRGWAHRPVRTLSRGLEQRCGVARALLHDPDLLLLDEPFAGLDVDATAMLAAQLAQARGRGATIVMATHDVARAPEFSTRAIVLRRGALVWTGALAGEAGRAFADRYREMIHAGSSGAPREG
ncbi:heme ABC exporter ATP-binding protein CcmA [Candidatus Binatia bacterium]|nr:heme ABC exporter ATP-binding protein CcmA [Candidatus Binatia bacterium]